MFDIKEELKNLPDKPGIYIYKDKNEQIIYIGKAKSLKSRVRQYFQSSKDMHVRTQVLVSHIKEFEYIVTDTEMEALILECNLIKEHSPKYNILLKDDKSYPSIKVTLGEAFPRIFITREIKKDKNKYYGPYTDVAAVKDTIESIHSIWKLKTCSRILPKNIGKERPCLNYHIGRCLAPCYGYISQKEYALQITEACSLLEGKHGDVMHNLNEKMQDASNELDFEKASEYRDQIISIKRVWERQKVESSGNEERDIIAVSVNDNEGLAKIFFVRNGKLLGHENFFLANVANLDNSLITTEFIKQFYNGGVIIPKEIIVNVDIIDVETIEKWLSSLKGSKVLITKPLKGEKLKFVKLVAENAEISLDQFGKKLRRQEERTVGAMEELKNALDLSFGLDRIEAYDISNISGVNSVGSMVVFENGKPKKNAYRKFKIKTVTTPDDYASMAEVLTRRFERGLNERLELLEKSIDFEEGKFSIFPDIVLVDGSKGQVNIALKVLKKLNILDIPVAGMVKDDKHNTKALWYNNEEILLKKSSEGFKLLTRIQDEVHRFAIDYHRKLRTKEALHSVLDDISGVGPKRRKALLKHFGSIEKIKIASLDELLLVDSINQKVANSIFDFFKTTK